MPQLRTCPPAACRLAAALLTAAALTAGLAPGQAHKADPVDEFRQALMLEQKTRDLSQPALDFRKENLQAKADQLKSLPDLSRALLLNEWNTEAISAFSTDLEKEARRVEREVRKRLIQRFVTGLKKIIAGNHPAQVAAAVNLLRETVVESSTLGAGGGAGAASEVPTGKAAPGGAAPPGRRADPQRLFLYRQLAPLAADLVALTRSPAPEVRAAAAQALGYFPTEPEVAVGGLRAVFERGQADARTRLAAATALENLVRLASGQAAAQRSSEPGVGTRREQEASSIDLTHTERADLYGLVVGAAAPALSDPDPEVRRTASNVLRQVTLLLRGVVPNVDQPIEYIDLPGLPYPAPGRTKWTTRERARVRAGRQKAREVHAELDRVLPAFQKNVGALTRASADPDLTVRIRVRQALEDLALVRRLLNNLDAFIPADPAGTLPAPGPDKAAPAPARLPEVSLGPPGPPPALRGAAAVLAKPVAAARPTPGLVLARLEQAGQDKQAPETAADALGQIEDRAGLALIQEGLRDPDPQGRLAAIDALELFGAKAEPAIPALAVALGDRNKFVRWAAARTLGRMAKGEREVLPGLVRLLCDPDLDVRVAALDALRHYGPKVAAAVPALTAALGRGDTEARIATLRALAAIGPAGGPSLPAVARALKNPDPRLRGEAARTLGAFGRAAEPFVADLRAAMEDPDNDVRKAASEAILRITPAQ